MIVSESTRDAEFLASEANGDRSRDQITVAYSSDLLPGTVLGQVTESNKYKRLDPDATDGSENAAAILYAGVDASGGDRQAVAITRDATVVARALTFAEGIDAEQQQAAMAQLAEQGIIGR